MGNKLIAHSKPTLGAEEEGNSLDVATFTIGYDVTGAQGFTAKVTTDVASI